MSKYKHLSLEEREKLFAWKEKGLSLREIGRKLKRHHTTFSKELERNTKYGKKYVPCHAQRRYERVTQSQRSKAPLKDLETYVYVRVHLRPPYLWTPELIAGRLKLETKGKLTITPEAIYQYIYSKKARKYKLWQYLPCGRKKRMKRNGRKVRNNGKAPNAVSIGKRPKYINKRKQPGHWETDNMEGSKSSKAALSVSIERSFRYKKLTKTPNQTMDEKNKAVIEDLDSLHKQLKRSITFDNGKENYGHKDISEALEVKTYFCHTYTSSEKGSVERAIKDIRRFIPKGTPLTRVSKKEIQQIENWLNDKPMKCLEYYTPREKMYQFVSKLETT